MRIVARCSVRNLATGDAVSIALEGFHEDVHGVAVVLTTYDRVVGGVSDVDDHERFRETDVLGQSPSEEGH